MRYLKRVNGIWIGCRDGLELQFYDEVNAVRYVLHGIIPV